MSTSDEITLSSTSYGHIPNDNRISKGQTSNQHNSYSLVIRQQPIRARLCSFKEKVDRRPIDPPPIIQLKLNDPTESNLSTVLQSPYFFMFVSLYSHDKQQELTFMNGVRTLAGAIVQSLYQLKDIDNSDGGFFIFPDISVRTEGFFTLKFTLYEIMGSETSPVSSIFSEVFQVFSQKTFPGMSESTFITRSFAEQGVRIRVRKETRALYMKRNRPVSSEKEQKEHNSQNMSMPSMSSSTGGKAFMRDHEQSPYMNLPQSVRASSLRLGESRFSHRQRDTGSDTQASTVYNQADGIRLPPIAVDPHESHPKKEIWEFGQDGRATESSGTSSLPYGQWRSRTSNTSPLDIEGTGHWEHYRSLGETENLVTDEHVHRQEQFEFYSANRPHSYAASESWPSVESSDEGNYAERQEPPSRHRATWHGYPMLNSQDERPDREIPHLPPSSQQIASYGLSYRPYSSHIPSEQARLPASLAAPKSPGGL